MQWEHVPLGGRVRLRSGERPPCDLLISRVHGSLRAREKELTGESKAVIKHDRLEGVCTGSAVVSPACDEVLIGSRRVDASAQLFRGTTVLLSSTDGSPPFVEGIAIRLGHQCKMDRQCALAAQPASRHLQRMSRFGMGLVALLLLLCYDNTLTIFSLGTSQDRSFAKVFFGLLIYENTMVPMSLKQVTMVACVMQAAWHAAEGVTVNYWQAVARLGELATAGLSFILTDKTGTLTVNRMVTQVVARRVGSDSASRRWAVFSHRTPSTPLPKARSGHNDIELLPPQPFLSSLGTDGDEIEASLRGVCRNWVATTSELPGEAVGEAEEASFLDRLPGKLLANVNDGKGGAELRYSLRSGGHEEEELIRVSQLIPLCALLRAKGAVVKLDKSSARSGWASGTGSRVASSSWSSLGLMPDPAQHPTYVVVMQGAGSFFTRMNSENEAAVRLFEGEEHPGLMFCHWEWRGSLRIWFHGEKVVGADEVDRYVASVADATSEAERAAALEVLCQGMIVTQANAMEDPYQEEVPECIAALREQGYRVVMVTGDSEVRFPTWPPHHPA